MIILIYVQLTRPKSFVYLPRKVQRFSAGGFRHHAGLEDLRGLTLRDEGFGPIKGTLLGTPNREPQEYNRYIIGIYLQKRWLWGLRF